MAYYYHPNHNVYTYEYSNGSNHSNGDYEYGYNLYSNHYKPNHYETNHSKPNCYEPNHSNPDHTTSNYYSHEAPKYKVTGKVHEPREIEYEVYRSKGEGYKHRELKYEAYRSEGAGYKPRELKYEGDEVHKLRELVYDDNERHELKELKWMVNEEGHKPQELDYGHKTQEHPQNTYEPIHELGYSDDRVSKYRNHGNRCTHTIQSQYLIDM